jgi:tetratricopeptide (TPR) repeat protein
LLYHSITTEENIMNKQIAILAASAVLMLSGPTISWSQPELPAPLPSQYASVAQTIGISEVQVTYHRPGVKGRQIWGTLVPYGEVWRAGANENTTISFSTPVIVGGKTLPKGTYGLHMIPAKGEWTIIFSKNSTSWGSYFYKESEDALRARVQPQPDEFHEWLQYTFSDLSDSTATLVLAWEKLRIPISLKFDTRALVFANARDSFLRGSAGFTWQGFNQAALYCAHNDIDLTQALAWADESIKMNENFNNLWTKAAVCEKMGKAAEAAPLRERALKLATESDINSLGYAYLNSNKTKEALELFQKNAKDHPDSWNAFDSLGECLEKSGDKNGAISNYEKALKLVGDERNKARIQKTIAELKGK